MPDRPGAALLYFKDENPSVNDGVFGSLRTGRPLNRTAPGADHLLPALQRMAAEFRKEIPKGVPEGTAFHAFRHAFNVFDLSSRDRRSKESERSGNAAATPRR